MPTTSPAQDCEAFLDFLYGEETGVVYSLVKLYGKKEQHFFQWPTDRQKVVEHVLTVSVHGDVYVGPALFKEPTNGQFTNLRGSNVVWADFDGGMPTHAQLKAAKLPLPHVKVRTSEGHEHWYWRLNQFETDILSFQTLSKSIAYMFPGLADNSGWDANQVLRPVGSVNHKPDRMLETSELVYSKPGSYQLSDFDEIEKFESGGANELQSVKKLKVSVWEVVFNYVWKPDEYNILLKKPEQGERAISRRGALLFRLASICAEKGMSDSEIYHIVSGVDKKAAWRKFADRYNAERCYLNLIAQVRHKTPYKSQAEQTHGFEVLTLMQHFEEDVKIDYILEGYLANKTVNLFMGKSGHGKTMMAMYIARCLVLKYDVMHFKNNSERGHKILYFSYEMNKVENGARYEVWLEHLTKEEMEIANQNFLSVYPGGMPAKFYVAGDQERIRLFIQAHKPDGILIDSASMSMAPHMSDEENLRRSIEFIRELVDRFNIYAFIIHHPRKDQPGTKTKDDDPDGSHGAQVLINQATTVMNIARGGANGALTNLFEEVDDGSRLMVNCSWRKFRLGKTPEPFHATLLPNLSFRKTNGELLALPAGSSARELPTARTAPRDTLQKLGDKQQDKKPPNGRRRNSPPDEF